MKRRRSQAGSLAAAAPLLVLGPIAEREVEVAARWYEAREVGLGRAFIDELLRLARRRSRFTATWRSSAEGLATPACEKCARARGFI
jgi:hypothetical protein